MTMEQMRAKLAAIVVALAFLATLALPARVRAQGVLLKDIANVQGVTSNQLIGYGIVVGLNQTGDSTSVLFTSKTIQNILLTFGLTTQSSDVRTRDVAAVMVTAKLPPFAHSGDNVDVLVSSLGDSTTLQGGTLVLTELRGPNNLVYATAQGPVSVGGFSAGGSTISTGQNSVSVNFVTAGRIPNGAVIARDMITNLNQDPAGFSYVLSSPDYKTASRTAQAINKRFGGGTARAIDAETVRVNLPAKYVDDTVAFLADASDIPIDADQVAKVVINERTGTIVMGGDITLAPVAVAHGNLSITISTENQVVPGAAFGNNASRTQSNTSVKTNESGQKLIYISGAATLSQVVRALNTIGVSPRDLIAIVQALRESGSLQAQIDII
jgi:flagellar P-ring protein precursor FlgI